MNKLNEQVDRIKKLMGILKPINEEKNFHYGSLSNDPYKPEYSDNIYCMQGRDTGHFGSGMYFSTYNDNKELDNHRYDYRKGFNKLSNNLVSIDLNEIPNMFRVRDSNTAKYLFETLKYINQSFYTYPDLRKKIDLNQLRNYWFERYRVVKARFNNLGITVPSIEKFENLIITAINDFNNSGDPSRTGSFSTRVMTHMGYSGVDVSGVNGWDNTLHGSVVYDIGNYENLVHNIDLDNVKKLKYGTHDDISDIFYGIESNKISLENARALLIRNKDYRRISYYNYSHLPKDFKRVFKAETIKKLKSGTIDSEDMSSDMQLLFITYIKNIKFNNIKEIVNLGSLYDELTPNLLYYIAKGLSLKDLDITYKILLYSKNFLFNKDIMSEDDYYNSEDDESILKLSVSVIKNIEKVL